MRDARLMVDVGAAVLKLQRQRCFGYRSAERSALQRVCRLSSGLSPKLSRRGCLIRMDFPHCNPKSKGIQQTDTKS